jgi:ribosome-binding factor A
VAEELRLKHTPTLDFVYDDTLDNAQRIQELLRAEEEGR